MSESEERREPPPEVDVEQLRFNLRLTPEQRVLRMMQAAKNLLELKDEIERARVLDERGAE